MTTLRDEIRALKNENDILRQRIHKTGTAATSLKVTTVEDGPGAKATSNKVGSKNVEEVKQSTSYNQQQTASGSSSRGISHTSAFSALSHSSDDVSNHNSSGAIRIRAPMPP